jgi:putative Mn2+ efflux pump MntP
MKGQATKVDIASIILISIGLSMDALAVSVAGGVAVRRRRLYNAFKFGAVFGFFQMMMPILGWASGSAARRFLTGIDHWIAFGLLCFIGGRMIHAATKMESLEKKEDYYSRYVLLGLAVATSIDALAVGVSFALLHLSILLPVVIVGIITFTLSYTGFLIGGRFGHIFENKIEIAGGLTLIGIGLKILLEHLY